MKSRLFPNVLLSPRITTGAGGPGGPSLPLAGGAQRDSYIEDDNPSGSAAQNGLFPTNRILQAPNEITAPDTSYVFDRPTVPLPDAQQLMQDVIAMWFPRDAGNDVVGKSGVLKVQAFSAFNRALVKKYGRAVKVDRYKSVKLDISYMMRADDGKLEPRIAALELFYPYGPGVSERTVIAQLAARLPWQNDDVGIVRFKYGKQGDVLHGGYGFKHNRIARSQENFLIDMDEWFHFITNEVLPLVLGSVDHDVITRSSGSTSYGFNGTISHSINNHGRAIRAAIDPRWDEMTDSNIMVYNWVTAFFDYDDEPMSSPTPASAPPKAPVENSSGNDLIAMLRNADATIKLDGNGKPSMRQDRKGFVELKKLIARERAVIVWVDESRGDTEVIHISDSSRHHAGGEMEELVRMELDDLIDRLCDTDERIGAYLTSRDRKKWVQRFAFLKNQVLPRLDEDRLIWLDSYLRSRFREVRDDVEHLESYVVRTAADREARDNEIKGMIESSMDLTFRAIFSPSLIDGVDGMPGGIPGGIDVYPVRIIRPKK